MTGQRDESQSRVLLKNEGAGEQPLKIKFTEHRSYFPAHELRSQPALVTAEPDGVMPSLRKPDRTPGWLLDEAANAGRENLDADHVSRYDAKEDAGAADEVLVLQGAGLTGESVVVEIGALVARALSAYSSDTF
jgi:hypothetical protein